MPPWEKLHFSHPRGQNRGSGHGTRGDAVQTHRTPLRETRRLRGLGCAYAANKKVPGPMHLECRNTTEAGRKQSATRSAKAAVRKTRKAEPAQPPLP
ncbi:hypothetical protein NDU88_010659 [Pleurodeles waltl]|uniref:Uncharacterized protein n=1 Tax=Pleurodeles waltl TaxID=8319 RepID=A0AAV7PWD0_PLEWA|nr:hypothetical protein NDU88_010659 [Pleurodeles waltl]